MKLQLWQLVVVVLEAIGSPVGRQVVRSDDWQWYNQDKSGIGVIVAVTNWKEDAADNLAVTVRWEDGSWNNYRWGAEGKFDVKPLNDIVFEDIHFETPQPKDPRTKLAVALVYIYIELGGRSWKYKRGWIDIEKHVLSQKGSDVEKLVQDMLLVSDPCVSKWTGIVCEFGNVISIALDQNNLVGEIPWAVIPTLHHLVTLDFSLNKIKGEVGKEIGELKDLKFLELKHNLFQGNIPDEIGNCAKLEWLGLSSNEFTGQVPESLSRIPALKFVFLDHNRLNVRNSLVLKKLSSVRLNTMFN